MMTTLTLRIVSPALVSATSAPEAPLHALTAPEVARGVIGLLLDAGYDVTAELVSFTQAAAKITHQRCEHCGEATPYHTSTCCRDYGR